MYETAVIILTGALTALPVISFGLFIVEELFYN